MYGHDHIVVRCTSTNAVRAVLDTTLYDNVSDLLQVGAFLRVLWFLHHSTNKTDHYDITEILLKVALNTITLTCNSLLEGCLGMKTGYQFTNIWRNFLYVYVYFSDEFKGHSILEGCRQADLARVKKYLEVVNFKHPYTGETALVRFHKRQLKFINKWYNFRFFYLQCRLKKHSNHEHNISMEINLVSYWGVAKSDY